MAISLKIAFAENFLVQPLKDGTVKPVDIELHFVSFEYPGDLFYRNLVFDDFDVSEMGIPWTIRIMERNGGSKWDWAKLPVFLSRGTGWTNLYVNTASGIKGLQDLKGKKICVPEYNMSMSMWLRVMLRDRFGIRPEDNIWFLGRSKERNQGGALGVQEDMPDGVSVVWLRDHETADGMLDQGKVDAAIIDPNALGKDSIDRYGGTPLTGNPRIRRLFPQGARELIDEFARNAGVFQLNHHVIVQNRILRQHPWVAMELFTGFERAKNIALEKAAERGLLGFTSQIDNCPLGIKAMRNSFDRYIQEMLDAKLIQRRFQMEDVYYPTTLAT